jgi:hypothetical protein
LKIAVAVAILACGPLVVFAGEETFEGFEITADSNAVINTMVFGNPETYLGTAAQYAFSISRAGIPVGCTVTFKDKVQRPMKQGEIALQFRQCGGPNAVWDYYSQHGRTVSYPPDNSKLPPEAYGKVSRIVCVDGSRYIGKLSSWANKPEGFSLTIEGASGGPVVFFNGKVKEIQQMK